MSNPIAAIDCLHETYHRIIVTTAMIHTATHQSHAGLGTTPYDRAVLKSDQHILDPLDQDLDWGQREFLPGDDGIIAQAADNAQLYLSALAKAVAERIAHYQKIIDERAAATYLDL